MSKTFEIAVFHGDGIGPEIMGPTLDLLEGLSPDYGFAWRDCPAGAASYLDCGSDLPEASLRTARAADAVLLSGPGRPGGALSRRHGDDAANRHPHRPGPLCRGAPRAHRPGGCARRCACPRARPSTSCWCARSTEGLFHTQGTGTVTEDMAEETLRLTRKTTEKVCRFACELATARRAAGAPGRVTSVDKANVFRAFAFWRRIFDEVAADFPELTADHAYVDAMALYMVQSPWDWDVMVTENMFGDILSDLGAGLMGGLGMAPSADIGDDHALFQPCHGSAPDIAGRGVANPFAMILSAGMMLDWLGRRHGMPAMQADALRLQAAVDGCLAAGETTGDLGGPLDTRGAAPGGGGAAVTLRVGLLGLGYFAGFHREAWGRIPGAALVATADADPARGANHADLAGLMAAGVDLLDIATPPPTHAAAIRAALPHAPPRHPLSEAVLHLARRGPRRHDRGPSAPASPSWSTRTSASSPGSAP